MAYYESYRDNEKNYVEYFEAMSCAAHFHSAIEILIAEKGCIDININGKLTKLHKGEVLVNNSYDIHTYSPHKGSIGKVIIIPKNLLKNYFTAIKNRKFESNIIKNPVCFEQLRNIYTIMDYYQSTQDNNNLIITNLGQSIFAIASSYLTLSDKPISKDTMKDILFYIYENFTQPIDLKTISKKFGYTVNHFSHIFNSYMQINLNAFINNLRAEKSAELIKNGKKRYKCRRKFGFSKPENFLPLFQKEIRRFA